MAALYLHNALFSPEPPPNPPHSPRSSRSAKSLSPESFRHIPLPSHGPQPSTSSQPSVGSAVQHGRAYSYESGAQPLLHRLDEVDADDAEGATYIGSAEGTTASYDGGRALKTQRIKRVRLRLRVTKVAKRAGEGIFALWTVYTTARYFIAYMSSSPSSSRETTNLVLGTLSALAFLPLALQLILSLPIFHLLLLPHLRLVLIAKWCLRSTAVLFLVVPAIVDFSFACAYIVHASTNCPSHLDISVLWGMGGWQCTASWIGMGILRLVLTTMASTLYILPVLEYEQTRHPSFRRVKKHKTNGQEETRLRQMSSRGSSLAPAVGHSHPSSSTLRHSSSGGTMYTANGSPRPSSTRTLPTSPPLSPSRRPPPEPIGTVSPGHNEELHSIADQIRTMMTQYHEEVDEAVNYARRDSAEYNSSTPSASHTLTSWVGTTPLSSPPASYASHSTTSSMSSEAYQQYIDHLSSPRPGYDEFGRPYPVDEQVSFLGGYVRRMPTIESLGSREYSEYNRSLHSRSNTRSTTFGGSRANSLHLPGEMATGFLAGEGMIREMGELAAQLEAARRSEPSSPVRGAVDEEGRRLASTPSGSTSSDVRATSRSTLSYYTATTGSLGAASGSAVVYEDAREE